MTERFHPGTFTAGVVFVLLGLVFALEAVGVWTLRLNDLALLGPLAIIGIGIAVLASTLWTGRSD